MVPSISTLVAHKHGMEPNMIIARNLAMAGIEHLVHTKHGDSSSTYRDKSGDIRMAGKIQGTGRAGCLWSIKSHIILSAYQELHKGIDLPLVNGTK